MILHKTVAPAEGEVSIKTYLCTSFSSFLFGIRADGYLEVTNKRLLFQAMGSGVLKSPSVLHSEVPISEVVGVNIYKGKAFNLLRLIGGILLTVFVVALVGVIANLLLSSLEDSPSFYQFLIWVIFGAAIYFAYYFPTGVKGGEDDMNGLAARDRSFLELLIAASGLAFLFLLAKNSMGYYSRMGTAKLAVPVCLATLLFILYRFARKPSFSLLIHSRSASNSIVRITGPSPLGAANSAAAKALTAKPAKDSLLVLKEVGALVLDIQMLGEFGMEKWRSVKP
jgi:hypothetical protein